MKDLVVIGAGGFAKEVLWLAEDCGRSVKGVLDDSLEAQGKELQGSKVIGQISDWPQYQDCQFLVAIGDPRTRKKIVEKMSEFGEPDFATLIHPNVRMSNTVRVGKGTVICAGSILTADIVIGEHNILNLSVTVGHDSVFSSFVTIAPIVAVSGNVTLSELVEVGTGAALRQGITIGRGAMLGMGGVLTKSIPENTMFIGNPAKKFREIK